MRVCIVCNNFNNLKHCGKCKIVLYCDRNCQMQHWSIHKKECVTNNDWSKLYPTIYKKVVDPNYEIEVKPLSDEEIIYKFHDIPRTQISPNDVYISTLK